MKLLKRQAFCPMCDYVCYINDDEKPPSRCPACGTSDLPEENSDAIKNMAWLAKASDEPSPQKRS